MTSEETYRKKKLVNEMLLAFSLYIERGIRAVENLYPQHKSFVLENKDKSMKEVKEELIHFSHTSA